jgi:very-short-patch-repair endonuclease
MTWSEDDAIDALAATQLGVVTRAQLRERGIAAAAINRRVRANRLQPLHRGVYQVGKLVAPYARELAAVLACGPHAVLSFRSAGPLWQLLPDPGGPSIDVITHGDRGRRPNIRVHRVVLAVDDVTRQHGVPITSVSRTLVDLAAVLGRRELERAMAQAERLNLLDRQKLLALTDARAGRPGAPVLRSLLEQEARPALTRSEAEERFLALVRKAQLPAPETNVQLGDYEVDFLWRSQRIVVEVDGFAFHSSQRRFESDRRRDARLAAGGMSVLRVTWRQVEQEPEAMLVRLALTLSRTGSPLM